MRTLLLFAAVLLTSTWSTAQVYTIENGTITACEGQMVDDGGPDGAAYTDTDYVFTICPDTPGDVIQVEFNAFSLQESANPANSDYLTIFDGDNTGELSLGSYTGNQLNGLSITGTVDNTSGCLTFVFTCNTGNTATFPGWVATIQCTTPCAIPLAASEITDPAPDDADVQTIGVCLNQEITFSDIGSTAGDGFALEQWIWNFDDGVVDTLSGPVTTHAFDDPGEYIVTLTVEDNNGCQSVNILPLQVLVSTIPIFQTEYTPQVCLGGTGWLNGNPVQSTTWTALPPIVVSGTTFLADGAGFTYDNTIVMDFFEDGAVLEDCEDLQSITINMEHSYLGDLGITIECPDGTTVTLLDWGANGGGGTFLGEAVDNGGSTTPGTGYDYGWAPFLTNGNLDDGNAEQVTFTDNDGTAVTNNVVIPGLYESDGNMCDLVGCPLNGGWTINVQDNLAIDDGYIFEWGLNLNPELYPDITTFTPVIGLESDSSYWEGPHIIEGTVTADGNYIEIEPPSLGDYEYTFFATNNFGCTFDTTLVVEVVNGPVVDAGEDITLCGELQLDGTIVSNEYDLPPCFFNLYVTNEAGDDWGWGSANVEVVINGVSEGTYSPAGWPSVVNYDIPVATGDVIELIYTEDTWGGTGNFMVISDDVGTELWTSEVDPAPGLIYTGSVLCSGPGQLIWEWTPADGLSATNVPNPNVEELPGTTTYTLTAYPDGQLGCATSDDVTISPAFEFSLDSGDQDCNGNDGFVLVDIDGATGVAPWDVELLEGGALQDAQSTDGGQIEFPNLNPGTYTVNVINDQCVYENTIEITGPVTPTLVLSNDTTLCVGGAATILALSPEDDDASFQYIWDNGLADGATQTVQPGTQTSYTVYTIDDAGCQSGDYTMTVSYFDPLFATVTTDTLVCAGGTVDLDVLTSGGGAGLGYTYDWTFNGGSVGSGNGITDNPVVGGTYCMTFSEACESPTAQDCFEVSIEAPLPVTIVAEDTDGCYPAEFDLAVGLDPSVYAVATWEVSEGTTAFNEEAITVNPPEPGSYDVSLTITSLLGCVYSGQFDNYLTVFEAPVAAYDAGPQPTIVPQTDIDFVDLSLGAVAEWYWVFDTTQVLGTSTLQNPNFTFPVDVAGIYPVSLTVTDLNGCTNTITRDVEITDVFTLYVPNAFSPNNDGINDVFQVFGSDVDSERFTFQIFNRWGEVIWETDNIEDVWLGNYTETGTHYVPDGLYAWRVVAHSKTTSDKIEKSGTVTVIR